MSEEVAALVGKMGSPLNNSGANPGEVTTARPPKEGKTNVDGPPLGGHSSCVKC